MSENSVTALWSTIAPALANHLWQSTLVALVAGVLALTLRKHHAQTRYWLWMAASLKFLFPFSLLVAVGRSLAWSPRATEAAESPLYSAVTEFAQPFATAAQLPQHAVASPIPFSGWTFHPPSLPVLYLYHFVSVVAFPTLRRKRQEVTMKPFEH